LEEQSEAPRSTATPLWFGPGDRQLFGWMHLPADRVVHGGVVLCQPFGIEAICAYFTYRLLAERLADRGLAVLRFDYDGTGDSCGGETDPDRLEHWLASVTVATDLLAASGVTALGLVGMRLGGLFAAHEAARRGGVDALVLWDPSLSGRSFLREQRFLRQMSSTGGETGDDAVEAPGLRFEVETVKTLGDLDLVELEGTLARQTLVLLARDQSPPKRLQRRLEGEPVEWQEATGQDRLLDSNLQEPALEVVGRLTDWLATALWNEPVSVSVPDRPVATVGRGHAGGPITERPVRLGSLGLFGIVTECGPTAAGPAIVLVAEGNTHHIGQARIWVDLARRLGATGFRVLRFDLSGNGDSGTRPGQVAHVARAVEAIDDVHQAMIGISPDSSTDVVLVGFCSGAYQVLEQALAHPPRGISVVNPSVSFSPPEPAGTVARPARQVTRRWFATTAGAPMRWALRTRDPMESERWSRALQVGTWPAALAKRHPRLPSWLWPLVNRTLLENTGISTLEQIVAAGVDTQLVVGPGDLLPIALGAGGRIRKLQESGRFHLEELSELDHASWVMRQRHLLIDVLEAHITGTFGSTPIEGPG
jgi:alpha-beta hydrolase superfamily lysophospholipase